ncbi:MAG: hypothetical protein DME20_12340 [Verrucomicrobia bacterium]|nr:MAG: hypothetical protein DME20_12340 [Verrucomicrobiota bacterium]TMB64935.1 MAG: hypothetical protein E6J54_26830 [Deltaproteobacteria bacterium]
MPNDPPYSDAQISVNAWLDANGVAHGTVVWVGGTTHRRPGGPADPWLIDVTEIIFDGNTAHVIGVVVHSVFPEEIGIVVPFDFRDNSGTNQPDEIGVFGPTFSPSSPATSSCANWSVSDVPNESKRQLKTKTNTNQTMKTARRDLS